MSILLSSNDTSIRIHERRKWVYFFTQHLKHYKMEYNRMDIMKVAHEWRVIFRVLKWNRFQINSLTETRAATKTITTTAVSNYWLTCNSQFNLLWQGWLEWIYANGMRIDEKHGINLVVNCWKWKAQGYRGVDGFEGFVMCKYWIFV